MSVHTFRQRAALHRLCPKELERMEREYYAAREHRSRHPFAIVCAIVVLFIVACALVACAAPTGATP